MAVNVKKDRPVLRKFLKNIPSLKPTVTILNNTVS